MAKSDLETSAGPGSTTGGAKHYSPNAVHMMRTAQLNTLQLSQMADHKASILLGATFLVFSLSVST